MVTMVTYFYYGAKQLNHYWIATFSLYEKWTKVMICMHCVLTQPYKRTSNARLRDAAGENFESAMALVSSQDLQGDEHSTRKWMCGEVSADGSHHWWGVLFPATGGGIQHGCPEPGPHFTRINLSMCIDIITVNHF